MGHRIDTCVHQNQPKTANLYDGDVQKNNNSSKRARSRSVTWHAGPSRGRSSVRHSSKAGPSRRPSAAPTTRDVQNYEQTSKAVMNSTIQSEEQPSVDVTNGAQKCTPIDKGKKPVDYDVSQMNACNEETVTEEFKIVIGLSDQVISARIIFLKSKFMFLASFVYGLNTNCQKRMLWNELSDFGSNYHVPWMLLGDFNNVLSQEEKQGGLQVKNYEIKDFATCVNDNDLSDLNYIGCFYTWLSPNVCSKLDRVLVNNHWVSSNLNGLAEFLAPGCVSDHTFSVVTFFENAAPKKRPFKFFNMWALSDKFEPLVQNKWRSTCNGTAQFCLKPMFKSLKKHLLLLNRNHFSHISERASKAKHELAILQDMMLSDGRMLDGYKELKQITKRLLEAELLFIAQKAKVRYTLEGSKSSTVPPDFNAITNGATVHIEAWNNLIQQPTRTEVDDTLFDIDNEKAPGADGFGAFFFKSAWHIIGNDVSNAVFEFFRNGRLLKQWNHSIISLIPKKAGATKVNDYRPISCCTVFYKIVSKMLVKRLKIVIDGLVDEAQTGFIEGRSIVDNIHLSQELLRKYASKCGSPRCITHLAYADDLLLLCRGDACSVSMFMRCLNNFGDMAGLRMNISKSNVYLESVSDMVKQEIIEITGFANGDLPFRYLGIPLASKQLRASDYSLLVDAISKKISYWPVIHYLMQGSLSLSDQLSRHQPIAWVSLCKPLEAGGFGLKNLRAWNKALIAKTLWNIHNKKDSLWIKWVSHEYGKFNNVWNWSWKKDKSPLIKQILNIREELITIHGSVVDTTLALQKWFGCSKGLSRSYDCFVGRWNRWPWKPLISMMCIVPKHRMTYLSDRSCVLCNIEEESLNHLFFECTKAQYISSHIRSWLGMNKRMGSPAAVLNAFRGVYRGNSGLNKKHCVALAATVYHI
ncbi:uncharacterized protein [Primulina huaijiensis]|uniref:uncharacterized protein n=1 Tax=Primulina huaijiensis TaxID=1492673 RepID=UPI003CC76700